MWIFNRKSSTIKALALSLGAALFSGGVASAEVVIDSFNTPPGGIQHETYVSASYQDTAAASEIIGGVRDYALQYVAGNGKFIIDVNQDTAGVASLSSATGTQGIFVFDYGKTADLNADLSAEKSFLIKIVDADLNGSLEVTVRSGATSAVKTVAVPVGASNLWIGFNQFAGINFGDVDQLTYKFSGPAAYDVAIDSITAVPVPSAVWAGLGLLSVVGVRRMRKFSNA